MATAMYKVRDVARLLNVSLGCVYALIESGRLACHRIGLGRGAVRVSDADLSNFLASSHHQHKQGEEARSPAPPRPQRKLKLHLKHLQL